MPTPSTPPQLIQPLDPGPVDIIGDVHGEIEPLKALLFETLGYSEDGTHKEGRRLVFLGDLVDRGPNSPAVVKLVSGFVKNAGAKCILGNHELNILRKQKKDGNEWFFGHEKPHSHAARKNQQRVADSAKSEILDFLGQLPLALERDDLRIVHACWRDDVIDDLRERRAWAAELQAQAEARIEEQLKDSDLAKRADEEKKKHGHLLEDKGAEVPMLWALAEQEELEQMGSPIKVLTSGVERRKAPPAFNSGKWRFTKRMPWWTEYRGPYVVFGHYWRSRTPGHAFTSDRLFDGVDPRAALGPRGNAMCIDYGIGVRAEERVDSPKEPFKSALAALRIDGSKPPKPLFSPR